MTGRRFPTFTFALLLATALLAAPQAARAQGTQIKPYMLIIVDTSGSMAFDVDGGETDGDGSMDPWGSRWCCPGDDMDGDTLPNDSRMYIAKEAMRQMVAGSGDITFGLMKFPQDFDSGSGLQASYYYDNQSNNDLDWLRYNGNGVCSSSTIGDYLVVPFSGESSSLVYTWMNHTEYSGAWAVIPGEYELRAVGTTPLAWTIDRARLYYAGIAPFSGSGVIPNDDKRDCRPYYTIILTDGAEACGGTPATEVRDLYNITYAGTPYPVKSYVIGLAYGSSTLNNMADYGDDGALNGSKTAYRADSEEELSAVLFEIIADSVLQEVCDGDDDDCDTIIDEGFTKYCDIHDVLGLGATSANERCDDPGETLCDGLDDNCDGSVDEGLLNACGTCGTLTEICNGIDDDCDTLIDEGGVCGTCVPTGEVCDGADNDCDTIADEDLTRPCGTNVGDCVAGTQTCTSGSWGTCVGEVPPEAETCNGEDDDCDGVVDGFSEQCELSPGVGDTGECEYGYRICTAAVWGSCQGGVGPTGEVCDGLDNNCDGNTDEGNPGGGASCGTDTGECVAGTTLCTGGSLVCDGETPPALEVCDGLDNDCDGVADDGNPGGGAVCGPLGLDGIGICREGVETCTGGSVQCVGAVEPTSEVCNGLDDDCDTFTDEGDPGGGTSCGTNQGECVAGVHHCVGGVLVCQGEVGPGLEVCDGLDNDCDGDIDEGNPGGGAICGSDVGDCVAGVLTCMGGGLVCLGEVEPQLEMCNGADDDCDGSVDEGNPGGGSDCGPVSYDGIGICEAGIITCTSGSLSCLGAVYPVAEVCNGLDDDCDGTPDDGNPGGGTSCGTDTGECTAGTMQCISGSLTCVGEVPPGVEVCNGLDDDCDGTPDDGNPGGGAACGTDTGECVMGTLTCTGGSLVCSGGVTPVAEICDGLDNDCDGTADEGNPEGGADCGPVSYDGIGICEAGTMTCTGGSLVCVGAVDPTTEVCNGLDDDCNHTVDDGDPGGGASCGSDTGECVAGTEHCVGGSIQCVGAIGPAFEVCDGVDNDCDGDIDEGNPGGGASCGSDTGLCELGTLTCTGGSLVCSGGVTPVGELCDGLDNDCDGSIDEGNPEGGAACGPVTYDGIGICEAGTMTCTGGSLVCTGAVDPITEVCNGLDDDCDGTADDGNPDGGASCGTDTGECTAGTETCIGGVIACIGEVAPDFEVCDGLDNDCDGVVDNGNPGGGAVCGTDTGECDTGILTCTSGSLICAGETAPVPELCDTLDNDCDGSIDEGNPEGGAACGPVTYDGIGICQSGTMTCTGGSLVCTGAVEPATEECNGLDDDCDGTADDGNPGGGAVCGTDTGECTAGTIQCVGGTLACIGEVGPGFEVCDGLDNDCDGSIDEGNPGGGASCGSDVGECRSGVLTCSDGAFICAGEIAPVAEVCNGLDDDCNGSTDEGNPEGGVACGPVAYDGIGICEAGVTQCVTSGVGIATVECIGAVEPGTEVCNGVDDDCNGVADDGDPGGGATCGSDVGECVAGTEHCVGGSIQCVGDVGPATDICDGLDNDCDGTADEGDPGGGAACGMDVGECRSGTVHCIGGALICDGEIAPTTELCNGLDDDCDGTVDDGNPEGGILCGPVALDGVGICQAGVQTCVTIGPGVASVECIGAVWPEAVEDCNGLDDDCNGAVDDDIATGDDCGTDVGECQMGHRECVTGVWVCVGEVGPEDELCDGLDNNCDGVVDEGNPEGGENCGTDVGECEPGITYCDTDLTPPSLVCMGEVGPVDEVCDGLDNDCNHLVDDGLPLGDDCGTDMGECSPGNYICLDGEIVCAYGVGPSAEVCDGLDNDCDGVADNEAECPGDSICVEGYCASPCDPDDEWPCPSGTICEEVEDEGTYCVGDPCEDVVCEENERCRGGECVSICDMVECPPGQVCVIEDGAPQCIPADCYAAGWECDEGERCVGSECEPDPCYDVVCGEWQFCREGECFDSCGEDVVCAEDERCVDGECVDDPCHDVECSFGLVCNPDTGLCEDDPCGGVSCREPLICVDGECVDDPCYYIVCPEGHVCMDGSCYDEDTVVVEPEPDTSTDADTDADTPTRIVATGAGGCAGCSVTDTSSGRGAGLMVSLLIGLAALLMGLARRRRRPTRASCLRGGMLVMAAAASLAAWGCNEVPYCLDNCDEVDGSTDAGTDGTADGVTDGVTDTVLPDTPTDTSHDVPDVCNPLAEELCNGVDDDCDGDIDEDFDLMNDPNNCGECGNRCELPHAYVQCVEGVCMMDEERGCDINYYDCEEDDPADPESMGCDTYCIRTRDDDSHCDGYDNDCDCEVDEDIDLTTDVDNCGVCGRRCRYFNAVPGCSSETGLAEDAECFLDVCLDGYHDLDEDPETGCEYECNQCQRTEGACEAGLTCCTAAGGETCNGLDDNCDGIIDEDDPGGGVACGSDVGQCSLGITHCVDDHVVCEGDTRPVQETCNGLDDDCDGDVDEPDDGESLLPDEGAPCGESMGDCERGLTVCVDGALDCDGDVGPVAEICDGHDNDCNGSIDDGPIDGLGDPCGIGTGECVEGVVTCVAGVPVCVGEVEPRSEVCDGLDNDCDGVVDDSVPGADTVCGSNVGQCSTGTMQCVGGSMTCQGEVTGTTEVCDGLDNDCDGLTDEGNPGGGASCGIDTGECVAGTEMCVSGSILCQGDIGPTAEICDGLDNDCNGHTDDGSIPGMGDPCGSDTGQCVAGVMSCVGGLPVCAGEVTASLEICDGLDNDCNGSVDDGVPGTGTVCGSDTGQCVAGTMQCVGGSMTCQGATGPVAEICDNLDNDCDGLTDEGDPGGGALCGPGMGECVSGTEHCVDGAIVCQGAIGPSTEICDGLDNDCNGSVDDGDPGGGAVCGIDTGECVAGIEHCVGGTIQCTGDVGPSPELCDTLDNDCNGLVDDGTPGADDPCGIDTGECSQGTMQCVGGSMQCVGAVGPVSEVCDNLDNDCDGTADDGDPEGGASCDSDTGECVSGTEHCVGGSVICQGAIGPTAEICDGLDNDCDGTADDGNPGGGAVCGSDTGQCVSGTEECVGGTIQCVGEVGPTAELCDTLDNDCDGVVDNDTPGAGAACGFSTGECSQGTMQCVGGSMQCVGAVGPVSEVCDNLDNDCDGTADDGDPEGGASCDSDTGECVSGTEHCVGGSVICQGAIGPTAEVCDGLDNDCDGTADDGNPGGGAVCGSDTGECVSGTETCMGGSITCLGEVGPTMELCDGLDNDCDGSVDNGTPGAGDSCGSDTGECVAGTMQCVGASMQCVGNVGPTAEICDGLDNDCDGSIDEGDPGGGASCENGTGECVAGTEHCVGGSIICQGAIGPTAEICDGLDNDCDGTADEDNPEGGAVCGTDTGECVAGTLTCVGGSLTCLGDVGPTSEVCDGLDNDCDGTVDNGTPGAGAACGSDTGECVAGTMECVSAVMECVGDVGPTAELCNSLDDDCDGIVDDGNPEGGATCGIGTGECSQGVETCVSGSIECVGNVDPTAEVCDGLDNDCDGTADNGDPGGGASCGSDVGECVSGTEHCVGGAVICQGDVGPTAEVCDDLDNDCDGTPDEDFLKDIDPANCGSCGHDCSTEVSEHAVYTCSSGSCVVVGCDLNWWPGPDQGCTSGASCCTYYCEYTGQEICDGEDNDCDQLTDTADSDMATVSNFCESLGACSGSSPVCTSCGGTTGWYCNYSGDVSLAADCRTIDPESGDCDDLDNDCDGTVDEHFPLKGISCTAGIGACLNTGSYVCKSDGSGVECDATAGSGTAEACNGLDDDCNGTVDDFSYDDWSTIGAVNVGGIYIFQHEASRPNAGTCDPGTERYDGGTGALLSKACSRSGVQPWANVSFTDARDACQNLGTGWDLCTAAQWETICRASYSGDDDVWAFATSARDYSVNTTTCNGNDLDTNCPCESSCPSGDNDEILDTGSLSSCYANWATTGVYDMTGNVKEWTSTAHWVDTDGDTVGDTNYYELRGGSSNMIAAGLTCQYDFLVAAPDFTFFNMGFRCCHP